MHNDHSLIGSRRPTKGFALVFTLMMMVLLTIIALGLLSLSSIVLRGSDVGKAQSTARANARLALMLAIGDLQKNLGSDIRASAPASQLKSGNVPNPDWIAAYNTRVVDTKLPMVGRNNGGAGADPNWTTDVRATQTNWRDKQRIAWLVSGTQPDATLAIPANSVVLAHLLSADGSTTRSVSAPIVAVNGSNPGNYAYWISDESLKARLDLSPPKPEEKPDLSKPITLTTLQSPIRHNAFKTPGFEWESSLTPDNAPKVVSLGTSQILQPDSTKAKNIPKHLGDFTTVSQSVLSNPLNGGLKRDLGAYLSNTADTVRIDLNNYKLGEIGDSTPMVPGDRYNQGGSPVMGMLRGWSLLGEDVRSSSPTSADPSKMVVTPRFPMWRATVRSSLNYALEGVAPALSGDMLSRVLMPGSPNPVTGMPIHPLMTDARLSLDFVYQTEGTTAKIIPLLYPRVQIWNPYNVKLKAASYVVVMPLRINSGTDRVTIYPASGAAKAIALTNMMAATVGGNWTRQYFCFLIPSESFGPGECKVYTPDSKAAAAPTLNGLAGCYSGSDISLNKLTASASSSGGVFYVPSTQTVDASLVSGGGATYKFSDAQCFFQAESWIFKGVIGSSTAISSNDLLGPGTSGQSFPTLQSFYSAQAGLQGYQSDKEDWNTNFQSAPKMNLRSAGVLSKTILAPAQLTRSGRWLTFVEAPRSSIAPGWLTAAWGSDYNPRAPINCRTPLGSRNAYYLPVYTPWNGVQPTRGAAEMEQATGSNGTSAIGSPFWAPTDNAALPQRTVFYDVPHPETPLLSLARLRHATLSRYVWHPNYIIGHSQISQLAESDASANRVVAANTTADQWGKLVCDNATGRALYGDIIDPANVTANQNLIYDLAFEVNNTLFDDYFLSGLPRSTAGETKSWTAAKPSANPLMMASPYAPQANIDELTTPGPAAEVLRPASLLLLKGGFNVNSTSLAAWKALLYSMRDLSRPLASGNSTATTAAYSRVVAPWLDGRPGSEYDDRVFGGFPALDDAAIDSLAAKIVSEVQLRGPFLTLGDFVTRRMTATKIDPGANAAFTFPSTPDLLMARMGTLDSAIEQSGVNSASQTIAMRQNLQYFSRDPYGAAGASAIHRTQQQSLYKNTGMPGTLTQGDLLEALGATLTTRGDTFVIRAYGEAREVTPTGKLLATAWCEAVVQRTPQYLLSNDSALTATGSATGNRPFDPAFVEEWAAVPSSTTGARYRTGKSTANTALDPLNERFGRRFAITSFRWLTAGEVNALS